MTLVKAGYIVLVFMHLGDERRNLKRAVIAPYVLFICTSSSRSRKALDT